MNPTEIRAWAQELLDGQMDADQLLQQLLAAHSAETTDATLDLARQTRCGFPEVIFAQGKSPRQIRQIVDRLREAQVPVLATRVTSEQAQHVLSGYSDGGYDEIARTLRVPRDGCVTPTPCERSVAVVTAGTADRPVADEARETLEWMGVPVTMSYDVGVAGPHRLPSQLPVLRQAAAVVVVAGMEGALPSVVGGYLACPVVAVPTSVGYGTSFGGVTALLGMLNSCAANVAVVNINAGFKGGYLAGMIAQSAGGKRSAEPEA